MVRNGYKSNEWRDANEVQVWHRKATTSYEVVKAGCAQQCEGTILFHDWCNGVPFESNVLHDAILSGNETERIDIET